MTHPANPFRLYALCLLLCALAAGTSFGAETADTPAEKMVPLIAWDCALPAGTVTGEAVDLKQTTFSGAGTVAEWRTLYPRANRGGARQVEDTRVYWLPGEGGSAALCLAPAMSESIFDPARRAGFLECGAALKEPLKLTAATIAIKFKLTGNFMWGGGAPGCELDGLLLDARPGLALFLQGRGPSNRAPHVPVLKVVGRGEFSADLPQEIPAGEWQNLTAVWQLPAAVAAVDPEVRFYLNGKEYAARKRDQSPATAKEAKIVGPVRVGGDGAYAVAPLELGGFSLFDRALTADAAATACQSRTYELHPEANAPDAWKISGAGAAGMSAQSADNGTLRLQFTQPAVGKVTRLMLKEPLLLDGARAVNFWLCQPTGGGDYGVLLSPIFTNASGKEIDLPETKRNGTIGLASGHIAPPNGRKGGVWHYAILQPQRGKNTAYFAGFEIEFRVYWGKQPIAVPGELWLKDLGLDRIDYAQTPLYYVLSNYRGNFSMVGFNGSAGKALARESGGSAYPFLLLDNAVDQAKERRPQALTVRLCAYDEADRPVAAGVYENLPARNAGDFWRHLEVPLTAPGTYRIQSRSYNAATGEYFTHEWTQLIIVRGEGKMADLPVVKEPFALSVNPDKPFGRLEKNDPRKISFVTRPAASGYTTTQAAPTPTPEALRYAVIPFTDWIPGRAARQEVKFTATLPLAQTPLEAAYEPKRAVELIVAELTASGKTVDRAEQMIGIRNELDAAPAPDPSIPTLSDLAGPGKIWMNSQLHANTGVLEYFKEHIGEIKKLSPLIGFGPTVARMQPMPGVYDWDYLQEFFDLAAANGCRMVPYLSQKWPMSWAPVEFFQTTDGRVHNTGIVWGHMVGGYNYAMAKQAPELLRQFNQQLARRFVNHPGFGAYYFENEHIISWTASLPSSSDPGNQARFAAWLKERYTTIEALNRAYGTNYSSFSEARLPDDNPARFPRRVMHADAKEYVTAAVAQYVLHSQFDAVRKEDPRRPILIYHPGQMPAWFYRHLADNGGMLANGGVHSDIDVPSYREAYNAVPGLMERMEPHDMWHYEPHLNGFDEMIFGMLAMGGRGLNFHFFLPHRKDWTFAKFLADRTTGMQRILDLMPALKELRDTEKLHDSVAILNLRKARDFVRAAWTSGHRPLTISIYVHGHYLPKYHNAGGEISYLDGTKLHFLCGEVIDKDEAAYLKKSIEAGAFVAMTLSDAAISLETPDKPVENHLLAQLGIDALKPGAQLEGVKTVHDAYPCGKGGVLVLRGNPDAQAWTAMLPAVTAWAGLTTRLADSDDKYMQLHVLQGADKRLYLAATHRGKDLNAYNGPTEWEGKLRFLHPLAPGKYRVTDIWANPARAVGVFTPAELAAGFAAGKFTEQQMKIFRIEPETAAK